MNKCMSKSFISCVNTQGVKFRGSNWTQPNRFMYKHNLCTSNIESVRIKFTQTNNGDQPWRKRRLPSSSPDTD